MGYVSHPCSWIWSPTQTTYPEIGRAVCLSKNRNKEFSRRKGDVFKLWVGNIMCPLQPECFLFVDVCMCTHVCSWADQLPYWSGQYLQSNNFISISSLSQVPLLQIQIRLSFFFASQPHVRIPYFACSMWQAFTHLGLLTDRTSTYRCTICALHIHHMSCVWVVQYGDPM